MRKKSYKKSYKKFYKKKYKKTKKNINKKKHIKRKIKGGTVDLPTFAIHARPDLASTEYIVVTPEKHIVWPIDWTNMDECYDIYSKGVSKTFVSHSLVKIVDFTKYTVLKIVIKSFTKSIKEALIDLQQNINFENTEITIGDKSVIIFDEINIQINIVFGFLLAYMTQFPFALINLVVLDEDGTLSNIFGAGGGVACALLKSYSFSDDIKFNCQLYSKAYDFVEANKIKVFGNYVKEGNPIFNIIFSKLFYSMYSVINSINGNTLLRVGFNNFDKLGISYYKTQMEKYLDIEKISELAQAK